MQVGFPLPKVDGLGHFFISKNSRQDARHAGSNVNSNNRETVDFAGLGNEATPSEGAKRRYPAHFLSKLTDADGELQETLHWTNTAFACDYLNAAEHAALLERLAEVERLLGSMINRHESFCF